MDGRRVDREVAGQLGRNVWLLRRRAGYSQEALGAVASLHRTEIGLIEHGQRLPRVDTLMRLAGALDVDVRVESLLEGIAWIAPGPSARGQLRRQEVRMNMNAKVTSVRLPKELADELDAVARADRLPVSELVRAALYRFIAERRSEPGFKERLAEVLEGRPQDPGAAGGVGRSLRVARG